MKEQIAKAIRDRYPGAQIIDDYYCLGPARVMDSVFTRFLYQSTMYIAQYRPSAPCMLYYKMDYEEEFSNE